MATKVTAVIRYDIFPYFTVVQGTLNDDGSVRTESGVYHSSKVLAIKGEHLYKDLEQARKVAAAAYDRGVEDLRVSVLTTHCDFLPVTYFNHRTRS